MTGTPEVTPLLRAWIKAARSGLLDALVALKLAEEDHQDKAKRQFVATLQGSDDFRNSTAHEEPEDWQS